MIVFCSACTSASLTLSPQVSSGQSALGVGGYVLVDAPFRVDKWATSDSSVLALEPAGNGAKVFARTPGTATIAASGDGEAALELSLHDLGDRRRA